MTEIIEPMPLGLISSSLPRNLLTALVLKGVELVGPGGVLSGLTKMMLETALEEELNEHLGYDKH